MYASFDKHVRGLIAGSCNTLFLLPPKVKHRAIPEREEKLLEAHAHSYVFKDESKTISCLKQHDKDRTINYQWPQLHLNDRHLEPPQIQENIQL